MHNITNTQIGKQYEEMAKEFLIKNKYKIIESNFYAKKLGEIDIIAKKDDIYHFVEVKGGVKFDAIYNITPTKISKLKCAIDYYIQTNKLTNDYQLDGIIFRGNDIEFLQNITL